MTSAQRVTVFILALASMALVPGQAQAANWINLGGYQDQLTTGTQSHDFYIDGSTIVHNGSIVQFWTRVVIVEPDGSTWDETKALQQINCVTSRIRSLAVFEFARGGNSTGTYNNPSPWTYIVPESVAESKKKFFCHK